MTTPLDVFAVRGQYIVYCCIDKTKGDVTFHLREVTNLITIDEWEQNFPFVKFSQVYDSLREARVAYNYIQDKALSEGWIEPIAS